MTDRIRVHVVQYKNCRNLTMRYVDPTTGKQKCRSSKTDNRKEARKKAAVWEDELNRNGGASVPTGSLGWAEFRVRYEKEVVSGLADKTAEKIAGIFNVMERHLPKVATGKVRDLNADRLSTLATALRELGRAESTIAGHLAHIRAALQWAADMDIIADNERLRYEAKQQENAANEFLAKLQRLQERNRARIKRQKEKAQKQANDLPDSPQSPP